jgi:MoxR-like ATPase
MSLPPPAAELEQAFARFRINYVVLRSEIHKVIVGQREVLDGVLSALLTGGHVLLEGVPGLGKTMLVRTIADALHLRFQRIQFTPDLMPADLIGTNVITEAADGRRQFEFQAGPVFTNILLADEVNRATPKTQSALLEAMAEKHVTVAGRTHPLPRPFFVLATQNPLEMEGTYPLPEAQLDRFCCKLLVRFPSGDELCTILERTTDTELATASPLLTGEQILEIGQLLRGVPVPGPVQWHAVSLVLRTHPDQPGAPDAVRRYVRFGSSPRGAQAVLLLAKVKAVLDGRFHVAREDIRAVAHPALRHRLILNFEGQAEGITTDSMIDRVLDSLDASPPQRPAPVQASSSSATLSIH